MKINYLFIGILSIFSQITNSINIVCDNYKNLWSINNEINGQTISNIKIFMCFSWMCVVVP